MRTRTHRSGCQGSPGSRRRATSGFTLAEMMVCVAVLGVLAFAMVPNYMASVYKARRTEALYALRTIHDAQALHFAQHHEYSDSFDELGFGLERGTLRSGGAYEGPTYTYTLNRWDVGGERNANYRATATGNLDPGDATLDIVIIENALTVKD